MRLDHVKFMLINKSYSPSNPRFPREIKVTKQAKTKTRETLLKSLMFSLCVIFSFHQFHKHILN